MYPMKLNRSTLAFATLYASIFIAGPISAVASFYNGGGVEEGLNEGSGLIGSGDTDIYAFVRNALMTVLGIMGAVAVAVIIAAGITLVIGGVSEENRDLARKMILWCVIGLIVIVMAAAIVTFTINAIGGDSG